MINALQNSLSVDKRILFSPLAKQSTNIDDSSCTEQIFVQSNAMFYAPPPTWIETIMRTIINGYTLFR